ncbi:hypothetical protein ACFQ3Z_08655 [Streptomyces nogalater]
MDAMTGRTGEPAPSCRDLSAARQPDRPGRDAPAVRRPRRPSAPAVRR